MVKSARRSFQILEYAASFKEGISHKELSNGLRIPRSSLSAILDDLILLEYIIYNQTSNKYFLGPQILTLAGKYLNNMDIIQQATPVLKKIVSSTGESALLFMRKGNMTQVVCKESSSVSIQRVIAVGEEVPLYATASGKAILAYLSNEELETYFSTIKLVPLTKKTITDKQILLDQIKEIRSGAIAYCRQEHDEHTFAMGLPIFDMNERAVGAITVPVPSIRFNREKEKIISQSLREGANSLSYLLGHQPKAQSFFG